MADDSGRSELSRRELLKQAGLAGAVAVIPLRLVTAGSAAETAANAAPQSPAPQIYQNLSPDHAETLEAVVARLIPTDAKGPGATEARATRYIDRALGNALASSRQAYADGLAALDRYARSSRGAPFARLSPADQDAVLIDVETNVAAGFTPSASSFFSMVLSHTIQGTFCDPFYGGNTNFVGWDLLGYPGIRLSVSANDQRLGVRLQPNHRSAYDNSMFTKTSARLARTRPAWRLG